MSLKIHLLGQFKLLADNKQLELPSRPAQSLLAYLVLNAGITQRREKLACLLWPDTNKSNARSYLRQALWRVRKSLETRALDGDDYLHISDISITFNDNSDYWLDAEELLGAVEDRPLQEICKVVSLYRGELLPGFYEEWVVLERDRLQAAYQQKMNLLLGILNKEQPQPSIEELRKEMGRPGISDDELLLRALFPEEHVEATIAQGPIDTHYPGGHKPVMALIQELMKRNDTGHISIQKGDFSLVLGK